MSDASLINEEIIDAEFKEISKNNLKDEFVITCKNAVPIDSSVVRKEGEKTQTVANVTYLCRDEFNGLFIISRVFCVNDELEELAFESLPFSSFDSDCITQKIERYWLNCHLPRYTTNFQFYSTDDYSQIYTYGIRASTGKKYKIKMSNEVFMGLLYLDKYPLEDDSDNEHDLSLAILNTSKALKQDAEFYKINKVEILEMADATCQEEPTTFFDKLKNKFSRNELVSTDIAVKFRLYNYNNPEESIQLLAPFDVGVVFDDEKYKGTTLESIQENYLKDADQYVANLTVFEAKLYGVDKTYMIIRGENKNKEVKLFLIDDILKEQINTMINNY